MVTAITVASLKPSLRPAAMKPKTPSARFAKPISCWNGLPARPVDRLRDRVRREDVTEEAAEPAPAHPDHEEIDQVHLYLPQTILRSGVESDMEGGEQHREVRRTRTPVQQPPSTRSSPSAAILEEGGPGTACEIGHLQSLGGHGSA